MAPTRAGAGRCGPAATAPARDAGSAATGPATGRSGRPATSGRRRGTATAGAAPCGPARGASRPSAAADGRRRRHASRGRTSVATKSAAGPDVHDRERATTTATSAPAVDGRRVGAGEQPSCTSVGPLGRRRRGGERAPARPRTITTMCSSCRRGTARRAPASTPRRGPPPAPASRGGRCASASACASARRVGRTFSPVDDARGPTVDDADEQRRRGSPNATRTAAGTSATAGPWAVSPRSARRPARLVGDHRSGLEDEVRDEVGEDEPGRTQDRRRSVTCGGRRAPLARGRASVARRERARPIERTWARSAATETVARLTPSRSATSAWRRPSTRSSRATSRWRGVRSASSSARSGATSSSSASVARLAGPTTSPSRRARAALDQLAGARRTPGPSAPSPALARSTVPAATPSASGRRASACERSPAGPRRADRRRARAGPGARRPG